MAKLNVNGKVREFEAEPDTPLLSEIVHYRFSRSG